MSIPKEMMTLADEVEFALRDAGWDIDKASIIATRIAAQDAEIERLRKDAERYRWIRNERLQKWQDANTSESRGCSFDFEGESHDVDACINAMMHTNMHITPPEVAAEGE